MSDTAKYIKRLLDNHSIQVSEKRKTLFDAFTANETNIDAIESIVKTQQKIMANWKRNNRIEDIKEQQVRLPNATVGKPYEAVLDFETLGWTDLDIKAFSISGLETLGLVLEDYIETKKITGVPTKSGDIKLQMAFKLIEETADSKVEEKLISLVINPDPRTLWQEKESDNTDPYYKPDAESVASLLNPKRIVVSSKRGRSHANVGSFRDDDFAFKHLEDVGWNVVAVADGAGTATLARQGSKLSCDAIISYFTENFTSGKLEGFDALLTQNQSEESEETKKAISKFVQETMGGAAFATHKQLATFASEGEFPLKNLHSTLIFVAFKKYEFGYVILSFGVGDCPIGLITEDGGTNKIDLLNCLDVGEFGGGTRFITMEEIFKDPNTFYSRINFKTVPDFKYLMLMTDGIYDAKFVVEANLEKIESWELFLKDLEGENEEGIKVDLSENNTTTAEQLSAWMDFWSTGNHDDRTLAIIY